MWRPDCAIKQTYFLICMKNNGSRASCENLQIFSMQVVAVWRKERRERQTRADWMSSFFFYESMSVATQWKRFDKSHYAKAAPERSRRASFQFMLISLREEHISRGQMQSQRLLYSLITLSCSPKSGHYVRSYRAVFNASPFRWQKRRHVKWPRGSASTA